MDVWDSLQHVHGAFLRFHHSKHMIMVKCGSTQNVSVRRAGEVGRIVLQRQVAQLPEEDAAVRSGF